MECVDTEGVIPSTPERPVKRFRNNSSPFQASSSSKSEIAVPCWEWKSGISEWTRYSPSKAKILEEAFCVTDRVSLPGQVQHEVDLRRFVQVNPHTGKERSVRRRLTCDVSAEPASPTFAVFPKSFDGRTVFLNRVHGTGSPEDVTFSDIIGPADNIEAILLSSYGTEIDWLLSHFCPGTSITLIDQPPEESHSPCSLPLGNLWKEFQLVHPKFDKDKGGLFDRGTMHCKLILIKFSTGLLRICISSANLVRFDWEGLTQVFWILDVDTRIPPQATASTFGGDLLDFVTRLTHDRELVTDWLKILQDYKDQISFQVPGNVHLVASVPGTHKHERKDKYGQLRLRRLLQYYSQQSVLMQISSIGQLQKPFMASFCESVRSSEDRFHIVWPEYSTAMHIRGKDHMMMAEKNALGASRYTTPLIQHPERKHVLNHSKCILASDFMYVGSHNLSMSAWGRLVFQDTALQIASYELGVLILDPQNESVSIKYPFDRTADVKPLNDQPWMADAFFHKVSAGTEKLSPNDLSRIVIRSGSEKVPTQSLADFLASQSDPKPVCVVITDKAVPVVSEYITNTVTPTMLSRGSVFEINLEGERLPASGSYGRHLAAFFECESFPAVILIAPGSTLNGELRITNKAVGNEVLEMDLNNFHVHPAILSGELEATEEKDSPEAALQFIKDNGITLLCLDVDGTVVESNKSSVLLPAFVAFVSKLDPKVKIALVTNQGAVGLRHWMTSASFGDPSSLPSQQDVEARILAIKEKIIKVFPGEVNVWMAFRYQSKGDPASGKTPRWGPVPMHGKDDPRWKQEWRKPNSGMIVEAMKWAGISLFNKSCVLMVGDMDSDEGAAKAAGVKFKRAPQFFTGRL